MSVLRIALLTLVGFVLVVGSAKAQHCASIMESYLSGVNIKRSASGLDLEFEYAKTGGRPKPAYQAYLLAHRDSNSKKISAITPQQAIAEKLTVIVGTKIAKQNDAGAYEVRWEIDTQKFAESMLTADQLSEDRKKDVSVWKHYEDEIRLSLFIPFLEDRDYSNIEGLPEDKHECNYGGDSALLFETLPNWLTFRFGPTDLDDPQKQLHNIDIRGKRPVKMTRGASDL